MVDERSCGGLGRKPVPFSAQGVSTPLALVAVAAGAFALLAPAPPAPTSIPAAGKVVERLTMVEAPQATRPSLLPQTIAMFALPQADARTWTERPATASASTPAIATRSAPLPRMAQAEADGQRRAAPVPPSRPATVVTAVAALPEPAQKPAQDKPAREPLRVLGFALPGSERLPAGGEALRAVAAVGSQAAAVGLDTAGKVGGGIVGIGRWAGDVVGLGSAAD